MAIGRPDDSNNINPYATSAIVEPHSEEIPAPQPPVAPRTYRIEMQWADRRLFLKTVGLLRLTAIAGALLGFYAIYGLLITVYSSLKMGDLATWLEPAMAARLLLSFGKAGLAFYMCWLQWTLADAIAATAGGTTGSMTVWSQIQRQMAILAFVTLALGVLSLAWEWLTMQFFFSSINR
jgi:hypothetical protein